MKPVAMATELTEKRETDSEANTLGANRVLRYAEELIFDRPLWHLGVALLLFDIVKNGVWKVPEISDWAQMAKSFPRVPAISQSDMFILSSPIGPAIAHYVGATSSTSYEVFSFVATGVAVAVLVLGLHRVAGRLAAGAGLVALFASPLSNTLLTWLGKEDPFLLMFTAVAILFESPVAVCIAGLGLATANPEAGAIIVLLSAGLRIFDRRGEIAPAIALIVGFGLGVGVVGVYDSHIDAPLGGRFIFVERTGARELLRQDVSGLPTWIFSVFGAYWVCVIRFWHGVVTGPRRRVVVAGALLCLVVTLASTDQSRIASLISLPLVLWFVVRSAQEIRPELLRRVTAVCFVLAIALPRVVVQEGSAYVSHVGALLPTWL